MACTAAYHTHHLWLDLVFDQECKSAEGEESRTFLAHECKKHGHIRRERGLKKLKADRNEKLEKYLKGSDRILDYGSGTGTLTLIFAGRAKETHGIDFASSMIEAAQRKAAESGIDNVRFMQTTIFDTRLEKGYIKKKE